jgi:hypothetical protein
VSLGVHTLLPRLGEEAGDWAVSRFSQLMFAIITLRYDGRAWGVTHTL